MQDIFGPEFLIRRPLLEAIDPSNKKAPILLIDELDRSDEEFEAFLLEILSDFQVTVPEIGTLAASEPPIVIITSNRTREIHDALRRRCLYYWIYYPTLEKELAIVQAKAPEASETLARQVCLFVKELRAMDLFKLPGISETLDWVSSLVTLDIHELKEGPVQDTLGALLKYQDDIQKVNNGNVLGKLIHKVIGS